MISTSPVRWTSFLLFLSVTAGLAQAPAQKSQTKQPQVHFLVARPGMVDPFFRDSVVLMLPARGAPLVVGLIVNKPSHISLHTIFPQSAALKKKDAPAYFGGPVDVNSASLIFRSPQASSHAVRLVGDIYLSFDPKFVESAFNDAHPAREQRLFLGRAQWGPDQLRNEMLSGAWYSVQAEGNLIFGPDPMRTWRILLERAEPSTVVEFPVLLRAALITGVR